MRVQRSRPSSSLLPSWAAVAVAVAGGLVLALAGCATSQTPPVGQLEVLATSKGKPLAGASCVVSTLAGQWPLQTPATVMVGEPNGDLRVVCDHPSYRSSEVVYRLPGSSLGGIGNSGTRVSVGVGGGTFGSASGVGVSMGIGFPLGGVRQRYPSQLTVDLTPLGDAP